MTPWWTMRPGPEREEAKAAFYADISDDAKPTYAKYRDVTLITFPDGCQAYQRRPGEAVYVFRSEAEAKLQYVFCISGQAPAPRNFDYVVRDGATIAVARSGREYVLWGADTTPRLRRVQLDAFFEAERELWRNRRPTNGRENDAKQVNKNENA